MSSFRVIQRGFAVGLLLMSGWAALSAPVATGQEDVARKVKTRVTPTYPELARRMNIAGVVRIQITVAPNGTIKSTKLIGGHPVLASAAMDALKRWRYEAGPQETTGVIEFHFDPNQ